MRNEFDSKKGDDVETAIARPIARIKFRRARQFTFSTAIAYLMAKENIDSEYRQLLEIVIETLVNREGIAGHPIEGLEIANDDSR